MFIHLREIYTYHDIFLVSRRKHILWVLISLVEALLMSAHSICFRQEIRKIPRGASNGYKICFSREIRKYSFRKSQSPI